VSVRVTLKHKGRGTAVVKSQVRDDGGRALDCKIGTCWESMIEREREIHLGAPKLKHGGFNGWVQ